VSRNLLEGPLPPEVSQFPRLLFLDASGNGLSGGVPSQLARSPYLASLSLRGNNFSGPVPPQLAPPNLAALTLLDLASNSLSGNIPFGFANASLYNLSVNFSDNNFSGRVPADSYGTVLLTPDQVANNSGLCGGAGTSLAPSPRLPAASPLGQLWELQWGREWGCWRLRLGAFFFLRGRDAWSGGTMLVFKESETPLTARYLFDATGGFSEDAPARVRGSGLCTSESCLCPSAMRPCSGPPAGPCSVPSRQRRCSATCCNPANRDARRGKKKKKKRGGGRLMLQWLCLQEGVLGVAVGLPAKGGSGCCRWLTLIFFNFWCRAELEDGTVVAIKRLAVQSSQGDESSKQRCRPWGASRTGT